MLGQSLQPALGLPRSWVRDGESPDLLFPLPGWAGLSAGAALEVSDSGLFCFVVNLY